MVGRRKIFSSFGDSSLGWAGWLWCSGHGFSLTCCQYRVAGRRGVRVVRGWAWCGVHDVADGGGEGLGAVLGLMPAARSMK